MTNQKLSAPAKNLCGRVALERTRPALWQETARLRAQALDKLAQGQSTAMVEAWLTALCGDALQAQSRGRGIRS